MRNVHETMRSVGESLNRALAAYEASSDADDREFYLLKIQALIFYYDVAAGVVSSDVGGKGFAKTVALKSLVHCLYEYDQQINRTLMPQIIRYAARRKKPIDTSVIKTERKRWHLQLARLKTWKDVRNVATGHYGQDIEHQIGLLKTLDQKDVFAVVSAFTEYNAFIIQLLPHKSRTT
jgi:hypothetical protein